MKIGTLRESGFRELGPGELTLVAGGNFDFAETDVDADGLVSLEEMRAASSFITAESFNAADSDQDGVLSESEMVALNDNTITVIADPYDFAFNFLGYHLDTSLFSNFSLYDDSTGEWFFGDVSGVNAQGNSVATHSDNCQTANGAAYSVAEHVIGSVGMGPPNPLITPGGEDWTTVELGTFIIQNADGSYGAYNDQIFSDEQPRSAVLAFSVEAAPFIQGIWHNHPPGEISSPKGNYPSVDGVPNDWQQLQLLKDKIAANDPNFDPSTWITGPDGITREFKLSERSYFEGLSNADKQNSVGLAGRDVTPCTP